MKNFKLPSFETVIYFSFILTVCQLISFCESDNNLEIERQKRTTGFIFRKLVGILKTSSSVKQQPPPKVTSFQPPSQTLAKSTHFGHSLNSAKNFSQQNQNFNYNHPTSISIMGSDLENSNFNQPPLEVQTQPQPNNYNAQIPPPQILSSDQTGIQGQNFPETNFFNHHSQGIALLPQSFNTFANHYQNLPQTQNQPLTSSNALHSNIPQHSSVEPLKFHLLIFPHQDNQEVAFRPQFPITGAINQYQAEIYLQPQSEKDAKDNNYHSSQFTSMNGCRDVDEILSRRNPISLNYDMKGNNNAKSTKTPHSSAIFGLSNNQENNKEPTEPHYFNGQNKNVVGNQFPALFIPNNRFENTGHYQVLQMHLQNEVPERNVSPNEVQNEFGY